MQIGEIEFTQDISIGIAGYAAFRDLAVQQDVGDFAQLEDLDDGGLFAIEVVAINPPALIPFEDVRADVIDGWDSSETLKIVMDDANERAARINSFEGLETTQETAIIRRGFINGTPPTFVTDVFEMNVGDTQVMANGDSAIIVRLADIIEADQQDDTFAAETATISETAAEGIAQDIYEFYSRAVQLRTEVQINDAAVNAIHTNLR